MNGQEERARFVVLAGPRQVQLAGVAEIAKFQAPISCILLKLRLTFYFTHICDVCAKEND